jgi:HJR/Mrr/RecB family endonuclease
MIAPLSASTVILLIFLVLSCFGWISGTVNVGAVLFFTTLTCISATFDDQRAKKRARLGLSDLQAMEPRELELHVARVLGGLRGWKAEATRSSADQGADVIATGPNRQRLAVQVKRYQQNVGNDAVQAVVASKALYKCSGAVVVTSGPGFTRAARELAEANAVKLWGPADLLQLQQAAREKKAPATNLLPQPPKTSWWT